MAVAVILIMIVVMPMTIMVMTVSGMTILFIFAYHNFIISHAAVGKQPHAKSDHGEGAAAF